MAMTTLRCRPPVQPTPIDRYDLPSARTRGAAARAERRISSRNCRGLGLAEHVLPHRGVGARPRAQLLHPVRVGEEAAVEHEVDVDRQAVLVPERHEAGLQRAGALLVAEDLAQAVAQLVHVELGGVDDQIGQAAQLVEQLAFVGDAVGHARARGERVATTRGLVAAHEHVVGGVEEQHLGAGAHLAQLAERGLEVVDELPGAHVDDEREAGDPP